MISSVSSIRFTVLMPRRRLRYLEASDTRRTRRRRRTRPVAKPPETLQMLLQPMQRTKSKPLARQTVDISIYSLTSVLGVSSFGSSGGHDDFELRPSPLLASAIAARKFAMLS